MDQCSSCEPTFARGIRKQPVSSLCLVPLSPKGQQAQCCSEGTERVVAAWSVQCRGEKQMVIFAAHQSPYCDLAPGYSCWHEERELQRWDGLALSLQIRHAQEIPWVDFFCLGIAEAFSMGSLHAAPLGPTSQRSWCCVSIEDAHPGLVFPRANVSNTAPQSSLVGP